MFFICVLLSVTSLIFLKKKSDFVQIYILPGIIILVILFNPIFIAIFKKYMALVRLARIIWLIPVSISLSYLFLTLLEFINDRKKSKALVIFLVAVIILVGTYTLNSNNFKFINNPYKLPQETIEICEAIKADGYQGTLMPSIDMVSTIRQYDANIEMIFGRNLAGYGGASDIAKWKNVHIREYADFVKGYEATYVLIDKNNKLKGDLAKFGYQTLLETERHYLYKRDISHQGEYTVTQYKQGCYTITDWEGNLIVINGGNRENREQVEDIIREYGRVDLWILTDLSEETAGAFKEIYTDEKQSEIMQVWTLKSTHDEICRMLGEVNNIGYLEDGEAYWACGMVVKVIDSTGGQESDKKNVLHDNKSMLLMFSTVNDEKIFFWGNASSEQRNAMLKNYSQGLAVSHMQIGNFDSKFIRDLCKVTSPNTVFADISQTDSEKLKKELLENYGTNLLTNNTAPNIIVIK